VSASAARAGRLALVGLGALVAPGPGAAQRAQPAARRDTAPPPVVLAAHRAVADDTIPVFRADPIDPTDTVAQAVMVELRIGRMAQRTVPGYRVRTEALLPLSQFLQMVEIPFRLSADGRLEGFVDPGRVPIVVDAASDTLVFGSRRLPIAPEFKRFADAELYVGAERLADLLGLRITVDWNELVVAVVDASALPIGRRLQREAAREAFLRRRGAGPVERVLGLERSRWGGLVLDYSVFLPSTEPLSGGEYAATAGADLLGGSLEGAVLSRNGIDGGDVRLEGSWTGVWRDRRWLTQLSAGDAFSTGPRLRQLQGITLTNSPYVRPTLVGSYRYGGRLEPGWVIEAYRNGALVGFDSADAAGVFGFDLPSYYGENPVDLVAYGPFGEVRRINRTYRVLGQLLPAGRFEYGLSAGACRSSLCDATGNLDLRYGVGRRWTARAGVEQLWRDAHPDLTQPYASVSGAPLNAVAVEVEALARGFVRGGVNLEPSLHLRLAADFTVYDEGTTGPALTPQGRRHEWGVGGFVRPIPGVTSLYVDAGLRHTTSDAGGFSQGRVGASVQADPVRLLPYVRMERTAPRGVASSSRSFVGVNAYVLPRPWLGSFWGALWARGDVELEEGHGIRTAAAVVGRELTEGVRLEVGTRYQRELGGASLVAMVQTYLPGARTTTAVDAAAGRPATGSFLLQGSAVYNESARRIGFTPGPSVQRAGLSGRVFLDDNANGEWDAGESGVGGVRVRLGNHTAVSDSDGVFRVWELIPFEPVVLMVDTLSIASPLVVPAFATASVTPSPNRFRTVNVPLVRSGVVEGRVLLDGPEGGRGLGGASVILTNVATGARQAVLTFSDGGFYVLGLKPGEYEIGVDPRVLAAFGGVVAPARVLVRADGSVTGPALVELRITPGR
jgi:hypothetical protein